MEKKIELYLPSAVYDERIITRAVNDYEQICKIKTTADHSGIRCVFEESIADLQLTAKEFANYLVELANSHGVL